MDYSAKLARDFAVSAHGEQLYAGLPYAFHLDRVAEIAAPYGAEAVVVAYLHDVVEDTPVSLARVREVFGAHAAECVALLSDSKVGTRENRKRHMIGRFAAAPDRLALAFLAKVADRLANVRFSYHQGSTAKFDMYQREHKEFREVLYRPGQCDELWQELNGLLFDA